MDNDNFPSHQFVDVPIMRKENFFPKECFVIPKQYSQYIDKVIIPKGMVHDRLEKLAENILVENNNQEVVFLVILKGGAMFAHCLFEKICSLIKTNAYCMKFKFEYISSTRILVDNINKDIKIQGEEELFNSLKGKRVILVEDTLDTGLTLYKITIFLRKYEPLSIKCAVLGRKMRPENMQYDYEIDYLGFLIDKDSSLVGFGSDCGGELREIDHVCTPTELCREKFKKKVNN